MPETSIKLPGGYAVATAIGYADATDGTLSIVATDRPLPVVVQDGSLPGTPSVPSPLSGSTAASGLIGPFTPATGRAVIVRLDGDWEGTVALRRSTDAGATHHGLTLGGSPWGVFTGNVCEPVWEESEAGAQLYLEMTIESGSIDYRIAQ